MRQPAKWLLLLLALVPGFLSSSCGDGCSGDGDADCSALTGATSAAPPAATPEPLTLACASPNTASAEELQWELTVGGGGAPYSYTIDFGDGTAAAAGTWPASGVHRVTHGYGRPGDFRVAAQVRDAAGRTQSCAMAVTAPAPGLELTCSASPRTGPAPLAVTFDAPPGGRRGCIGSCTVSWSFGDGAEAEAGRASHEYAQAGSYEAVATLHDGPDRRARCRVPIEVQRATAPEPIPNRPPTIDGLTASPSTIVSGQSAAISGSTGDPDAGDTTTWSLTLSIPTGDAPASPASAGTLSPSSGSGPIASTFTSQAGTTGSVIIKATVTDSRGATTERSVNVSVTAANRPPVILSLTATPPLIFAQLGGGSTITGAIMDPDDDPVTWTFSGAQTANGSGPIATTSFGVPAGSGGTGSIYTFILTARDPGGLTATRTVTVTVIGDAGRPPTAFDSGGSRVP